MDRGDRSNKHVLLPTQFFFFREPSVIVAIKAPKQKSPLYWEELNGSEEQSKHLLQGELIDGT